MVKVGDILEHHEAIRKDYFQKESFYAYVFKQKDRASA